MSLSPGNEPPEDIQELISSTSPNCSPSAAPRDMKSGRGWGDGGASSRTSTSEQGVVHGEEEASRSTGFWTRYFSVSLLLLLGVTASLVILPLVLPPLPPPPSMLLLVPVAMLLVLLVLAFMPTSSGGRSGADLT
ncbi:protein AUXIN-REGULATED GENE INVOLVED IN ORGAN SIZE-like [Phragmites australis]|uniref:protein AUXIN-REGULATED GENE INVOLVED IN ORGAN SIZE-like n=1 Tax=Phragmites australis TaxID=29695 RepID=UPI002D79985E|nr:protein AUXIN-REGULATED GENE INVOLVED IN ORGAN SIZE-like [Phragmites australis]XP_062225744.1 protein AUXIN-REGULATED GENE INVOLVED IN ORGAN SIZE-like [Phragmites australis]XP_062225745.1 protein AUXIN-REGULATED GENE INVOLVED IN ORGAN SIZE-like [Phragmites australis]XP_062225746.1 protein AUXIN-REGULATED GENE INVOLVED IN ORGAN SIZE-like [Phragmites australis]